MGDVVHWRGKGWGADGGPANRLRSVSVRREDLMRVRCTMPNKNHMQT